MWVEGVGDGEPMTARKLNNVSLAANTGDYVLNWIIKHLLAYFAVSTIKLGMRTLKNQLKSNLIYQE